MASDPHAFERPARPVALTIAGSDPSGGAGIQADLKTFTVHGVYGASVITALTAQNTTGVTGVMTIPADFVLQQLDALLDDLPVAATKTGMLPDIATIEAIVARLHSRRADFGPLIVDPVIIATSGDRLVSEAALDGIRHQLLPLADLVTPNLDEAAALTETPRATDREAALGQGRKILAETGVRAVLVKGGHFEEASATDDLITRDGVHSLVSDRIETRNTHGTGCTLSAAITANMAQKQDLPAACSAAKRFIFQAIRRAQKQNLGRGCGPVDHFVTTPGQSGH